MKELSLNILDITENSVKAKASLVEIIIQETEEILTLIIRDNGSGMTKEMLSAVRDPFFTTRTTRKVGMGIPLLQFAAEQTGGRVAIKSTHEKDFPNDHGTEVTAVFYKNHIDFTPLGDVISTLTTLIQGHPEVDFLFTHTGKGISVELDTRQLRQVLGDVPLNTFEVLLWIKDNMTEQYNSI